MAILSDAQLLVKKVLVTVIIYLIPVAIIAGGLLLTKHLLDPSEIQVPVPKSVSVHPLSQK